MALRLPLGLARRGAVSAPGGSRRRRAGAARRPRRPLRLRRLARRARAARARSPRISDESAASPPTRVDRRDVQASRRVWRCAAARCALAVCAPWASRSRGAGRCSCRWRPPASPRRPCRSTPTASTTPRCGRAGAEALLVTPAHQFPTGVSMSPERRARVLAWAAERDAFVFEDDYDAEYRYDRAPIGALQGLDPACVVYAGSVSKTMAPALRLGWLVVPPALRAGGAAREGQRRPGDSAARAARARDPDRARRAGSPSPPHAAGLPAPARPADRGARTSRPGWAAGGRGRRACTCSCWLPSDVDEDAVVERSAPPGSASPGSPSTACGRPARRS